MTDEKPLELYFWRLSRTRLVKSAKDRHTWRRQAGFARLAVLIGLCLVIQVVVITWLKGDVIGVFPAKAAYPSSAKYIAVNDIAIKQQMRLMGLDGLSSLGSCCCELA